MHILLDVVVVISTVVLDITQSLRWKLLLLSAQMYLT